MPHEGVLLLLRVPPAFKLQHMKRHSFTCDHRNIIACPRALLPAQPLPHAPTCEHLLNSHEALQMFTTGTEWLCRP